MKRLLIGILAFGSISVGAAEICVLSRSLDHTRGSQEIYAKMIANCTDEQDGLSFTGKDMNFDLAAANLIKKLVEKGYQVKSDNVLQKSGLSVE